MALDQSRLLVASIFSDVFLLKLMVQIQIYLGRLYNITNTDVDDSREFMENINSGSEVGPTISSLPISITDEQDLRFVCCRHLAFASLSWSRSISWRFLRRCNPSELGIF